MADSNALDRMDREILAVMLKDKTNNLTKVAAVVNLSKSAVEKRVKRLMKEGFLKGYLPLIDKGGLPGVVTAFSLIRAKYGPKYSENIGKELAKIDGVCGVYFVLGDNDFIVILKAKDSGELNVIVNKFAQIKNVERSNTIVSLSTEYEDISKFFPL